MQSEKKIERKTLVLQSRPAAIKALCEAAKKGDLAEVKQWLELNPSLIKGIPPTQIPLAQSLFAPHPEVFFYLLSKGADITVKAYHYSFSPAFDEASYTLAEVIALGCSRWPATAKEAALQALAKKGMSLNPFFLAACKGEAAALSQEALSSRNSDGNSVAHYASANGQLALLKQIYAVRPDLMVSVNKTGLTPLLFAARNGHLPVVQWLPREGWPYTDLYRNYALEFAVHNGHLPVVQWLLRQGGARICRRTLFGNDSTLLNAVRGGHLATVQWLLREGGAQITDSTANPALLQAAYYGHLDVVQWLLREGGAQIAERTMFGDTALQSAAMGGHLATVQWLLREGGARITERSNQGNSWAIDYGYIPGYIPGATALLFAAYFGHLDVVQWLLREGGAQITERENYGRTALQLAARAHHAAVVNLLISEFGANPGDGTYIARLLHDTSSSKVREKAHELQDLYVGYHLRQQPAVTKRLLEAALPDMPNVLRGIMAQYVQHPQPTGQEPLDLPKAVSSQNDRLLEKLKAHAESWKPWLPWRDLSGKLMAELASQHPCHALTIHLAVSDFLAAHTKQIAGSELSTILDEILDKTAYFKLPAAGKTSPGETKKAAEDTTRTQRLIQGLTHLPDPRLHGVNWQPSRAGKAIAYFDDEAQAKNIQALLRGQRPGLSVELTSQADSTSPTLRYVLSVAAPDEGIALAIPPSATHANAAVSPSALSSPSALFAESGMSSFPAEIEIELQPLPSLTSAPRSSITESSVSSIRFFASEQATTSTLRCRKKEGQPSGTQEPAGSPSTRSHLNSP